MSYRIMVIAVAAAGYVLAAAVTVELLAKGEEKEQAEYERPVAIELHCRTTPIAADIACDTLAGRAERRRCYLMDLVSTQQGTWALVECR